MKTLLPASIRWYQEGEIQLPSVTSVLQLMPDDPYIEKWKNWLTPEEYLAYMAKIYRRWDIIHKLCENHFAGIFEPIPLEPEYQPFVTGFHRFLALYNDKIRPHKTEERIASVELWVAWRLDFICEWDGIFTLIDWKTSSSSRIPPALVDKYKMQTAIYVKIWNVTHDRQVTQAVVVPLTNANKKWLGVPEIMDQIALEHYWNMAAWYILDMNLMYNNGYLPTYFQQ